MLQITSSMEMVYALSQSFLSLPKGPFLPTYSFYYLLISLFLCVMGVLPACSPDPLGLELQTVVICPVGVGNRTWFSLKNNQKNS